MAKEEINSAQIFVTAVGMNIHLYTSIYMNRNEVEHRLGTYAVVLVVSITLTYSQNDLEYTCVHPHPSQASR
jgi:NADH:ubiquinone oxidoreductase subunit 5 (subunit L)/multisubunit Na+/H+ antiporter MnhA subunit